MHSFQPHCVLVRMVKRRLSSGDDDKITYPVVHLRLHFSPTEQPRLKGHARIEADQIFTKVLSDELGHRLLAPFPYEQVGGARLSHWRKEEVTHEI